MILKEWNVWHCYSTYVLFDVLNLEHAARLLVESGIAEIAMVQSGEIWWRDKEQTKSGHVWAQPSMKPTTTVHLPAGMPPYVFECAGQASLMAHHESRLFPYGTGSKYLRAYLGMIQVRYEGIEVALYPQIKLFEDGVLLTQFRVLSSGRPLEVDTFVDSVVNLFQHPGVHISLPPNLLKRYVRAVVKRDGGRLATVRHRSSMVAFDQMTHKKVTAEAAGDFEFQLVGLEGEFFDRVKRPDDPPLGLRLISQMVEYSLGDVLFRSSTTVGLRSSWRYPKGEGSVWIGRPAVYLIDYQDRARSATSTISKHKVGLAKILCRASAPPADLERALTENWREFDDYAVFVNPGLTLWVVADLETMAAAYVPDALGRHFIFEKHVQAEFVEHLHAAYRRVQEQSMQPKGDLRELLRSEYALAELERTVDQASPYRELVRFFRGAQAALGHHRIRRSIKENLRLRSLELADVHEGRATKFGWALTLLLGLSVVPSITDGVIAPLFRLNVSWWNPATAEAQALLFNGISLVSLFALMALAYLMFFGRRPKI